MSLCGWHLMCVAAVVYTGMLAADWQAAGMMSRAPHFRARELIHASLMSAHDRACGELQAFPGQGVVVITGSLYAVAEAYRLGVLRAK